MIAGHSRDLRVSGSLLRFMHTSCSAYGAFHVACISNVPTLLHLPSFVVLSIIYTVDSPLLFQFSVMGARAEAGAGLRVGQALRYSTYLVLGSAVPAKKGGGIVFEWM